MQTDNRLFITHSDQTVLRMIRELVDALYAFSSSDDEAETTHLQLRLALISKQIQPEEGFARLHTFLQHLEAKYGERISAVDVGTTDELLDYELVYGGLGPDVMTEICRFLSTFVDGVQIWAWGTGDDDPQEYWLRAEQGRVWLAYDEPSFTCEEADDKPIAGIDDVGPDEEVVLSRIMPWWFHGLPTKVKVGLLNKLYNRDSAKERIVFASVNEDPDAAELFEHFGSANIEGMFDSKPEPERIPEGTVRFVSAQEIGGAIAELNAVSFERAHTMGRIGILRKTIGSTFWRTVHAIFMLVARVAPTPPKARKKGVGRVVFGLGSVVFIGAILWIELAFESSAPRVPIILLAAGQAYLAIKRLH